MASLTQKSVADIIEESKLIVVKIGSALLAPSDGLAQDWMRNLAEDVAGLMKEGRRIVLVSSGAIAAGRQVLSEGGQDGGDRQGGQDGRGGDTHLATKQALAALGQIRLSHAWKEAFSGFDLSVGQVLVTTEDTEGRKRHLNARATFFRLLEMGAVPVVNENDTVASEEIRFGDNDRLAARVAVMLEADLLILLSDVDGLYERDPRYDKDAKHIGHIGEITPAIEQMAGRLREDHSHGGMITKIQAAKIATSGGCRVVIASGHGDYALGLLRLGGSVSTVFEASVKPRRARQRWIAGMVDMPGILHIDEGAARALAEDKSLLAAGVTRLEGVFGRGDAVSIVNPAGVECGRGLVEYDSAEMLQILGVRSGEIERILGYKRRGCLVHRDNLVRAGSR